LGSGCKNRSVLELSNKIKQLWFQTNKKLSLPKLLRIKGIGQAKACILLATQELCQRISHGNKSIQLDQPHKVFHQLGEIKNKKQEHAVALYLNGRGELILKKIIAVGTLNTNFIDFRQLFAPAITLPANGFILAHNHPSGDPHPSPADIKLTKRINKSAKLLGIKLIDHLVITNDQYFSFKKEGLL
ncbi:MAG: DNA repair protein RadC, partial [Patescibacteria group bacterium]|nr:DNA repair protein RadC [Patescibacteria group bacterium]